MHFFRNGWNARRIPDYPDAYYTLNMVASAGSAITIISIIIFLYVIFDLVRLKKWKKINQKYWEIMKAC